MQIEDTMVEQLLGLCDTMTALTRFVIERAALPLEAGDFEDPIAAFADAASAGTRATP